MIKQPTVHHYVLTYDAENELWYHDVETERAVLPDNAFEVNPFTAIAPPTLVLIKSTFWFGAFFSGSFESLYLSINCAIMCLFYINIKYRNE